MEIRSNSVSPARTQYNQDSSRYFNERYKSYSRVEGYVKHLNNIYHSQIVNYGSYDHAYESTSKFRTQTPPTDSIFKVSYFPKNSNQLAKSPEVVRSKSTTKTKKKSPTTQKPVPSQVKSKEKIYLEERCFKCFKIPCLCANLIQVSIFKNLLAKNLNLSNKCKERQFSKENFSGFHRKSVTKTEGNFAGLVKSRGHQVKTEKRIENVLKITSFRCFRSNTQN